MSELSIAQRKEYTRLVKVDPKGARRIFVRDLILNHDKTWWNERREKVNAELTKIESEIK